LHGRDEFVLVIFYGSYSRNVICLYFIKNT